MKKILGVLMTVSIAMAMGGQSQTGQNSEIYALQSRSLDADDKSGSYG
jgi:hypothetical protein